MEAGMPEKPAKDRSAVSPKDQTDTPCPPTPSDNAVKAPAGKPEDDKRIERFPER